MHGRVGRLAGALALTDAHRRSRVVRNGAATYCWGSRWGLLRAGRWEGRGRRESECLCVGVCVNVYVSLFVIVLLCLI